MLEGSESTGSQEYCRGGLPPGTLQPWLLLRMHSPTPPSSSAMGRVLVPGRNWVEGRAAGLEPYSNCTAILWGPHKPAKCSVFAAVSRIGCGENSNQAWEMGVHGEVALAVAGIHFHLIFNFTFDKV